MTNDNLKLAYIAGIFDGEGHCSLQKKPTGYSVHVNIRNTNRSILHVMQKLLELGYVGSGNSGHVTRKDCFQLWFPIEHTIKFLKAIQPYVIIKSQQIALVLEYVQCSRGIAGKEVTKEMEKRREEIYYALKSLNKVGK